MDSSICSTCHSSRPSLSRCTGCLSVSYCNSSCQRRDWPQHKLACAKLKLQKPVKSVSTNPVQVASLSMLASKALLDCMEKAAINLVTHVDQTFSLSTISSYLTLHLQGVQSSSIRQSLLQEILSGQFPSMGEYRVCQIRNYVVVTTMGVIVDFRDLDRNKITYEEEIELTEDILENIFDVVAIMICMVVSGDIPIIDLGRLYVVEAATGNVVKTNELSDADEENEDTKNLVISKSKLLNALNISLLECEANLSHPPSFKLTKLDLATNEPVHNCNSKNSSASSLLDKTAPKVKQFMMDIESLVATFPMCGRTMSALTDLRLGNCLNNLIPIQGKADVLSQMVMAGVGQCCPSLKVLDLRGSEMDPAIAIWLLLADPFIALHKYCYSFYEGNNGKTEIRGHKEDCEYCRDQEGRAALEAKMVTMVNRKFHWSTMSDDMWELLEKNRWHYVNNKALINKMMKENKADFCDEDDEYYEESDESSQETDDDSSSEDEEKVDDDFDDKGVLIGELGHVDKEIKCQFLNTTGQLEKNNCDDCSDQLEDWQVKIDPSDPLYPLLHVLSASSLIRCLEQSPTSPCNPLASTLEVLYISGHSTENLLSEAIFPFLLTACPNLKILGDSLAALKGLRLYSAMEDARNCVTELRELDLVYPSTYDMSGTEPSVAEYVMLGAHNSIIFPQKDSISSLLPCVPISMVSSEKLKGLPSKHGWLNSENISLIDLYLEKNPLKDITNPLVLGQMVGEDCELVGRMCPKLTTLNINLDHPWGVANNTHFWSGLAPLSLTSLQITNGRWENVSPLLKVVGRSLKKINILLPKRNDALQGEVDCLARECPLLEHLYLGVGTSPLEVKDIDTFVGFKHLKTIFIGEAFKWTSFLALVSLSPNLEKVQMDKINEQVVGKPPNVTITRDMVSKLDSMVKDNSAGAKVTVLSFSWLDLEKEQVVETLQSLIAVFPALKWLGSLALGKREIGMIEGVVSMALQDGLVIDILDKEEVRQPGEEFEGLPIGMGCCIA